MVQSAINISKYLIYKALKEDGGELLSNMKLQKLLYYCQGGYYAKYKEKLFEDKILALHGPVVAEIYHEYKNFGSNGIELNTDKPPKINLSDNQTDMIDDVYDFFKQFSAVKLMDMTHNEDLWKDTVYNDEISLEKLYQHFNPFFNEE